MISLSAGPLPPPELCSPCVCVCCVHTLLYSPCVCACVHTLLCTPVRVSLCAYITVQSLRVRVLCASVASFARQGKRTPHSFKPCPRPKSNAAMLEENKPTLYTVTILGVVRTSIPQTLTELLLTEWVGGHTALRANMSFSLIDGRSVSLPKYFLPSSPHRLTL